MKQKYMLSTNSSKGEFLIEEFAELEPGKYFLMCKGIYDMEEMKNAVSAGAGDVIQLFRTSSVFPDMEVSKKIADGIAKLYADGSEDKVEILHNDRESLKSEEKILKEAEKEDETVELDALLDDDEDEDLAGEAEAALPESTEKKDDSTDSATEK